MSDEVIVYDGGAVDGDLPAIMDDRLIALAGEAEKRIEAMMKIKRITLGVTNSGDWIDQNGKPYLQVSGAEKVGRVFGLSWDVDKTPSVEESPDGHFTYIFRGTFWWGNAKITAEGSRSSKDPFFSKRKGEDVVTSEIDKRDVRMAAYTNCLGNGITRLLGIRNLTWEDVQGGGIKKSDSTKIDYNTDDDATKAKREEMKKWLLEICFNNQDEAQNLLEKLTTFTGRDGEVKGKRAVAKLTPKQVPITHKQIKALYDKHVKELEENMSTQLQDAEGLFGGKATDEIE